MIADYTHIYLSPHFDDAALSVGGMIAQQTADQAVLVITICSAPPRESLNSFAQYLHQQWGNPRDPIAVRQAEDRAAVSRLGADLLFLGDWDAIYRHPAYNSVEAIFGTPVDDDPLIQRLTEHLRILRDDYSNARWYAPLAIGNHVDHQVTHQVARQVLPAERLWFYEDLPYATNTAVRDQRLAQFAQHRATTIDITDTLVIKLTAIADYASQMLELFGDETSMRQQLSDYARSIAPNDQHASERLWQLG